MGKFKYLFKRIVNMNYKNFFDKINYVHEKTGKNRIYIFCDMVWCGIKYQAGYMDYQLFEMYNMNKNERETIMTRGKNNELIKKYNNKEYTKYFDNKVLFNKRFEKYINRDWILVDTNNYDEFKKIYDTHDELMLKPVNGSCGTSIEKVYTKDYKSKELYNYILDKNIPLVEEVAIQCDEISKLHPSSINTLRVITFKGKVILAYIRIGNHNNCVDNFNHGGMAAPIDIKSGIIKFPAIDKEHNVYNNHPLTKEKIVGLKVPNWNKVVKLVESAAKEIKEVGYVGWDVCDGETPSLIEGNDFPGHDIYQLPPHRDGNTGVYPLFKERIKEDENSNCN